MGPVGAQPAPAPGPTNVVIISKVPEGATEQQISAGAGRYGDVLQVVLRAADLDGPGWALVAFASPELAKAARERLDGKPLPGLPPSSPPVDAALGEGLFGNVRRNDQDSPWREARTPQGQVYYFHAVTRQTAWTKPPPEFAAAAAPGSLLATAAAGRGAAAGAKKVSVGAQAQAAIQAAQAAVAAQQVTGEIVGSSASGPVGANLFVYHIPNSWDDNILRQHFEHFGRIVSCRVQKDNDGRPRGFGFVSYDAPPAAQAAIAGMHGFPVEGKWLKVQLKKGDEQQLGDKASIGGPSLAGHMAEPGPSLALPGTQPSFPGTSLTLPSLAPANLPPPPPPSSFAAARGSLVLPPRPGPY